jgi:amino acid adenylation domain-containing protein
VPFEQEEIEGSVPDRLRRVVTAMPDHPAIKTPARVLTYRDLDRQSGTIAGHLAAGVPGSQQRIGLLFSPDEAALVVAVFGVLKAGHCYVGLSLEFPAERNRAVWADADGALVLTSRRHVEQAAAITHGQQPLLVVEDLLAQPRAAPVVSISGRHMAALFYTSGSTGRPKGVVRQHREMLYRAWVAAVEGMDGPDDRVILSYFIGYAASAARLFGALLNGALAYPLDARAMTAADWIDLIQREAITIFEPPIALVRQIVAEAARPLALPCLRLLGLGGDVLLKQDVEALRARFPKNCLVMHRLACSEAGVITRIMLRPDTPILTETVPSGYAMPGMEVLIWDGDHRPVAPTEAGEIVVRTSYLSPGYWRNPEQTRQVFLPDPDGGDLRLYLTGDLGRLSPDGCLEHLGRKDQMLKIRGHRVEPEEIEAALRQLEGVAQAVVIAREREAGEKELVAWIVPAEGAELSPAKLRGPLSVLLPSHMLPARFVVLDHLPMTVSGKVDRQSLAGMQLPPLASGETYVPPRDDLERQMVNIWQAVLKVPQVGVQDNFFDLGGNSLAAMALMTRLATATGRSLPLTALFVAPTVEQLAAAWRRDEQPTRVSATLVPLQPLGSGLPVFLVPELEASALNLVRLIRYMGTQQPVYGLHPRGFDDGLAPHATLPAAAAYYLRAIRTARPAGPYLLAGICYGGLVAFEMAQQLVAQGQTVLLLALIDVTGVVPQAGDTKEHALSWFRSTRRHWNYWKGYTRERLPPVLQRVAGAAADDVDDGLPSLPAMRRLRYVQRVAHLRYRALPYPGRVHLLQSEEFHGRGYHDDWSRVVPAGLSVDLVLGTTHRQLLSERPFQRQMAQWLEQCLGRAASSDG